MENIAETVMRIIAESPESYETDIGRVNDLKHFRVGVNTRIHPPYLWISPKGTIRAVYVCEGRVNREGVFVPDTAGEEISSYQEWLPQFEEDVMRYDGVGSLDLFLQKHPRVAQFLTGLSTLGRHYA